MEFEKLLNCIEQQLKDNNETFFSYAWREKICEFLESESKYSKLIDWINRELDSARTTINLFNPADKNKDYTIGFFKTYKESCASVGMLLNFKLILIDKRTTTKMRESIEETMCKVFGIKYCDLLKDYIPSTVKKE